MTCFPCNPCLLLLLDGLHARSRYVDTAARSLFEIDFATQEMEDVPCDFSFYSERL